MIYSGERHCLAISWFTALICLLGCAYYFFFFYNRAFVELEIEVDQKTSFKIYWASENQPFSEKRRGVVTVLPNHAHYSFFLTDLGRIDRLRIDPFAYAGKGVLKRLRLTQKGFEPVRINFEELEPLHDIKATAVVGTGLFVESAGADPTYLFTPHLVATPRPILTEMFRYVAICALILLAVAGCAPLSRDFSFVPVLLAVVFGLIAVMAVVSERNAHPDEYVHLEAASYYMDHLLPPEIEDEQILQTYSAYGVSRLNNGEIYYLLAGKFAQFLAVFKVDALLALRGFNLLLFGFIFLYTVRSVEARIVALPFLLTPQVWYIFSYCVSDGLGLFLCFLAGCELIKENSYFNRILAADRSHPVGAMLLFSALLGSLFLLKINYYPFVILVYAVILYRWVNSDGQRRTLLFRVLICSILAVLFAGLRIGADYYVNGADREEKLLTMREKTADHWYKPSTELHKKHVSMYMRQRGTSLERMIFQYNWFGHTFETGTGKYGYFTISGSAAYYQLMKWLLMAFLLYICVTVTVRGDSEGRLLALLVVGLSLALVAASIHRSWTVDFQAQGRYLFPILPMIGVVLARNRTAIEGRLFFLLFAHVFLLSLYSFIFVALPNIPRA